MTREELENLWRDRRNWKWGVYYCKADPRVIVPKRVKWMGWTINFALPSAVPVFLGLFAVLLVPLFVVSANGAGKGVELITLVISVAALCGGCAYFSSRTQ